MMIRSKPSRTSPAPDGVVDAKELGTRSDLRTMSCLLTAVFPHIYVGGNR